MSCGCNPVPIPFEFPISNSISSNVGSDVIFGDIELSNQGTICELKRKIICDFYDILKKLQCGIQPDLEFLLEEISVVYGEE